MEEEMWLARDSSGSLFLYEEKPLKFSTMWVLPLITPTSISQLNSSLFPEVKWLDDEPTKVKLIISK